MRPHTPAPQVNATYVPGSGFHPYTPSEVWVSTGLWAKAGSMLTIQLDSAWASALQAANQQVGIQIGMHTGDISL